MLYMATWIPSIYPLYVCIYTSTMDPMGMISGFGHNVRSQHFARWDLLHCTAVVRTGCPICLDRPARHLFQVEQLGSLCGGVQWNNQQVERSMESYRDRKMCSKCMSRFWNESWHDRNLYIIIMIRIYHDIYHQRLVLSKHRAPQNPMVDNNHVYRLNGNCRQKTKPSGRKLVDRKISSLVKAPKMSIAMMIPVPLYWSIDTGFQ